MKRMIRILFLMLFCRAGLAADLADAPLADVHVHYKWSQEDVTSPQQAVDTLVDNNVALAVVIGMPAAHALELERLDPERIVPIWSPYRTRSDATGWAFDKQVLERWDRHAPTEDVVELDLEAGAHTFRLEHFEIDGWAWLTVRLEQLGTGRPGGRPGVR